jgi:hypothetical protein
MKFHVDEKVDILLPISLLWIIGYVRQVNEIEQYYRVELESFEFTSRSESTLSDIMDVPFDKEDWIQRHGTWCFDDWRQNIPLHAHCELLVEGQWQIVEIVYYSQKRQELLLVWDDQYALWEPLVSKKIRYGWDI